MEKNEINKIIIQYLKENDLKDVADLLIKESNYQNNSNEYEFIMNILKDNNLNEKMENYDIIIDFISKNISTSKKKKFLLDIYAPIFYRKIFLFFDNITIENLLFLIQSLVEKLTNFRQQFPNYEKKIKNELNKIENTCQIIYQSNKRKEFLLNYFPQIENNNKLIEFINSIYFHKNNPKLEKILHFINLYNLKKNKMLNDSINSNNFQSQKFNNLIPYKIALSIETKSEVQNLILSNSQKYFCAILNNHYIITYKITKNENNEIEINEIVKFPSYHTNQITQLTWNDSDTLILTSSKDKTLCLFNPMTGMTFLKLPNLHSSQVTGNCFINDDIFASCGLDNKVNFVNTKTGKIIDSIKYDTLSVINIKYSKFYKLLISFIGTKNSIIFYNFVLEDNNKFTLFEKNTILMNDVIISCNLSQTDGGKYLIVNESKITPTISLIDLKNINIIGKYIGHKQNRFTIRINFGGYLENFICSGSENGKINLWSKTNSIQIFEEKLHKVVVNEIIWPHKKEFKDFLISGTEDMNINIIINDNIKKVSFSKGNATLENKVLDMNNQINSKTVETPSTNNNFTMLNRLGNIFRQIQSNFNINIDDEEEN